MALSTYASFWNRQGTNLDSALEAARRSVELTSDYYNNFTLGQVLFKLKRYDEALKAAEKAVELVKPMAAQVRGLPDSAVREPGQADQGRHGRKARRSRSNFLEGDMYDSVRVPLLCPRFSRLSLTTPGGSPIMLSGSPG
ncbi:MAG: tetratricopeptide repeat protein [Ignavibacteriales bacterium]|nr:tetratricopeptide repeat protein [Ignavibacteriales bacterium]